MTDFDHSTNDHAALGQVPDSWLHQNRYLVVVGLVFLLAFGLWSVRDMILDDFPRMEPWQKVLFWLGDLGAVAYAVRWMVLRDDADDVRTHIREQNSIGPGKIAVVVAVSLILDMVVTLIAMMNSYQSMDRALMAKAKVVSTTTSPFRDHITYYRLIVEYEDANGRPYSGWVKFRVVKDRRIADWKLEPLKAVLEPEKNKQVDVIYDPRQPNRVWLFGQTWDKTAGLEPLFAVIHICQIVFVWGAVKELLDDRQHASATADLSAVPMLPLAIEAFCLVMAGLFLHMG